MNYLWRAPLMLVVTVSILFCPTMASSQDLLGLAAIPSITERVHESRHAGRPLFAMVTSQTCPPCRALKHTIATNTQVRTRLAKFELLVLDVDSSEVNEFKKLNATDTSIVPMLVMLRPDGVTLYSQAGNLPAQNLVEILQFGLDQSGLVLDREQQAQIRETLKLADEKMQQQEYAAAFQMIEPIAALKSFATDVRAAQTMRDDLIRQMGKQLQQIDAILQEEVSYGAAYRLADLFVAVEPVPDLRSSAAVLLAKYEDQRDSAEAIHQGKELVRARFFERRNACRKAIASYDRIVATNADSPIGLHASKMIDLLRQREAKKITRASS